MHFGQKRLHLFTDLLRSFNLLLTFVITIDNDVGMIDNREEVGALPESLRERLYNFS